MRDTVLLLYDNEDFIGRGKYAGPARIGTELSSLGLNVKLLGAIKYWPENFFEKIIESIGVDRILFVGVSSTFLKDFVFFEEDGSVNYLNEAFIEAEKSFVRPFGQNSRVIKDAMFRLKSKGVHFVLGGSDDPQYFCDYPFDFFIRGQADKAIFAVAKHYLQQTFLQFQKKEVQNVRDKKSYAILSVESQNYPVTNFTQSRIEWNKMDFIQHGEALPIEIARGCVFNCSYCNYDLKGKKRNDYVKLENALQEELLSNYKLFGTKTYYFCDDLFNDSIDKVKMFHELKHRLSIDFQYGSYLRLDLLYNNEEMVTLLKESGLKHATFGIETLHNIAGIGAGKGLGKKRTIAALELCRKVWGGDVIISSNFICGLPGEPLSHIEESYQFLKQANLIDYFRYVPLVIIKDEFSKQKIQKMQGMGLEVTKEGLFHHIWKTKEGSMHDAINLARQLNYDLGENKVAFTNFSAFARLRNIGMSLDAATSAQQVRSRSWDNLDVYIKNLGDTFGLNSKNELDLRI